MNNFTKRITVLLIILIAVVLVPKDVFAKDVYDIVLFWGQSNMVGKGIRDEEFYKDYRLKNITTFSNESGIDTDILNKYSKMNHVDVPITANTVYDYTYNYDTKKDLFTAVTSSTANIGKTIWVSVKNNAPVFSSASTGTYAVHRSYGTQMSPYFGKVWYEKTGHKLVIVLAANGGEEIANFLPHGTKNTDNQYIYEAMKDIYKKAVSYVKKTYGTNGIGHKFYVVFQGESNVPADKRDEYKSTFLEVHNNLKNDLGLEFGVMVETSSKLTSKGKYNPTGVEAIHNAQEQIIRENSDIILGSSFSYDNYNSIIDGDSESLRKACLARYQINDNDYENMYHFNAAGLSQIGKDSATNAANFVLGKNKVTVRYNKNDGTDKTTTQSFEVGNSWNSEIREGNKFGYNVDGTLKWENTGQFGRWDREGYKLLGWNFKPDDTEARYSIYSTVSDNWILKYSPEVNLYAIWQKKDSQKISFNSNTISKVYGAEAFTQAATLTTGDGTVTYKSSDSNVATVNSATGKVTIKAVGSTTITATASETTKYAATSASYTLNVTKAASEIELTSTSSEKAYNDAPFYIEIKRRVGNGEISYTTSNSAVATVNNEGKVTIVGSGNAKITVKISATDNYSAASAVYNLTVNKGSQTIQYKTDVVKKVYGDEEFINPLSVTVENGTITYSSSNTNVASINNSGKVTINGVGETVITATLADTNNYNGGKASYRLTVSKANQKLRFSNSRFSKKLSDKEFKLEAVHSVGDGQVTYTSSNNTVATVNNSGVVSIKAPGTAIISATAASTANYNEVVANYTLNVADDDQRILFSETEINKTYGDADFNLTATVFVDSATVTYASSNTNVATINSSGKVTIVGSGTTKITATINPGSTNEKDKAEATLNVAKANQKISFLQQEINKNYLDSDFVVQADLTGVKGSVTYSSDDTNVATVDDTGKVHIVGIGSVKIKAIASETGNYNSASASYILKISKIDQQISFSESSITRTYGDDSFTVQANRIKGDGAISYRSSNTNVASVDNNGKVTIVGAGYATITATASANINYNEARASYALIIRKADQAIKFDNTSVTKKLGDASFTVEAVRTIGDGEITYTSSNEKVAIVDDNGLIKILGKGSATITATANETKNYNKAAASYSLNVLESPQTLNFKDTTITVTYGDESPVIVLDHSLGDGNVFYESDNENVATIDKDGKITIKGAGETVITAIASATDKFDRTEASFSLIVKKAEQEIKVEEKEIVKKLGNDKFKLNIDDKLVKGEVVLISEDEDVARINDDNYIELLKEGQTNIIVKALETDNYNEDVTVVKLRVEGRVDNKVVEVVSVDNTGFDLSKIVSILSMLSIIVGIILIFKVKKA